MSTHTFILYLATWLVVALTPGPAVMCSMAQSTRYGFRSSLAGVFGVQLGIFILFVCIALGLGTLLATATTAFILRVAWRDLLVLPWFAHHPFHFSTFAYEGSTARDVAARKS